MGASMPKEAAKRNAQQKEVKVMCEGYMKIFDKSKTGTLSREEVITLAKTLLDTYTPLVGGLKDDDVDMIMRCGGDTCKDEITAEELPLAVSIMYTVRDFNQNFHEMFVKFDVDKSGKLPADQLTALFKSFYGGDPHPLDVNFVLHQLEPRGTADPIGAAQLKAALACWYCMQEPTQEKIKAMFKKWDKAGNGVISRDEFRAVMTKLKSQFTQDQLDVIFNEADKNGNNVLDYNEFVDFLWHAGLQVDDTSDAARQNKGMFSTGGGITANARAKSQDEGKVAPSTQPVEGQCKGQFSTGMFVAR
eukprot:gnl/TRDRNA2_/TRDRNA2_35949_c0_seq1.p1 gnl/TRDRNA2_/TRDRNA2_35949_c0~~gnl/TRDRNA2_/TRDRNA2_35949_c0_seq1.p1  ORF type:complete len:304 (-),score=65.03 gnl/TRDRNA2_/TRDRNA2_35949_c0_seq1:338-1249(-)